MAVRRKPQRFYCPTHGAFLGPPDRACPVCDWPGHDLLDRRCCPPGEGCNEDPRSRFWREKRWATRRLNSAVAQEFLEVWERLGRMTPARRAGFGWPELVTAAARVRRQPDWEASWAW